MKKIVDFIKKYKLYILGILFLFYFFRSCSKSTQIKKLERTNETQQVQLDSLSKRLDSVPETIRVDKINIHLEYDRWISSKDRGPQLMELHSIVKNNIEELQKK